MNIQHHSRLCAFALAVLAIIVFSQTGLSQSTQRDPAKEAPLLDELKKIAPASVDDFVKGTQAMDAGHYEDAKTFYEQVLKKADKWDVIYRRLGFVYLEMGDRKTGIQFMKKALELKGSADDELSMAIALSTPPKGADRAPEADLKQALSYATTAESMNTDKSDPSFSAGLAQIAVELGDITVFRNSVQNLRSNCPNELATHYFSAILDIADENFDDADAEITAAEQKGLPKDDADKLRASGISSHKLKFRIIYIAGILLFAWIAGIAVLYLAGTALSKYTLRELDQFDPGAEVSQSELRIRRIYRGVVNFASIYYFLSMPVLILLMVGVIAGVVYLSIYYVRSTYLLAVGLGALVTVYSSIRAMFIRTVTNDPGRMLERREAPGLWDLVEATAKTLETKPISEIRITPGTDVAVYERGTMRERMNGTSERVLILGVAVLNNFPIDDFRAVLAHEYGHFLNRDTAGGAMALRVRKSIGTMIATIVRAKQNTYWNLGFHFIRLYGRVFIRVSEGASRLQEAMADRLSARHYGGAAFERGLRHVIYRGNEFKTLANDEINQAIKSRRPATNLYELNLDDASPHKKGVDKVFTESLTRQTSEFDSHPSPIDRFRYVANMVGDTPALEGQIWDLFADRSAIISEMSGMILKSVPDLKRTVAETTASS